MNALERRSVAALALLYCFRMLGLFMVLPLLTLYAAELPGATPVMLGLAVGMYGLTQALLQIPLGMLSDRVGRLPVLLGGLLVFALGSIVAAQAETIQGVVVGRLLQGAGAISSTVMALIADLTRDEQRTKAMAVLGISIGFSFALAIILGPLLATVGGLSLVFYATGGMALLGMGVVLLAVPRVRQVAMHGEVGTVPALLWRSITDRELLKLNLGVFMLHFVLMASFLALPLVLEGQLGLRRTAHWQVYLPVMALSLVGMALLMFLGERGGRPRLALLLGIVTLAAAQPLALGGSITLFSLSLLLYFSAFNYLEAVLPSLVSKVVYAGGKGTALGAYASFQFLGAFAGGAAGGLALEIAGVSGLLALCSVVALLWLPVALSLRPPQPLESVVVRLSPEPAEAERQLARLQGADGVVDMLVLSEEATVYLKIDAERFDPASVSVAPGCSRPEPAAVPTGQTA